MVSVLRIESVNFQPWIFLSLSIMLDFVLENWLKQIELLSFIIL